MRSDPGHATADEQVLSWPAQHVFRFLCVAGMVFVHGFYWVGTSGGRLLLSSESPYYKIVQSSMILGFLPLLLPFTAGCALRFRFARQGAMTRAAFRQLIVPAVALVALGTMMNVLAAGWYARWAWNVLQFVGLSYAVIGALLWLSRSIWPLTLAGILVLMVSDPLRAWIPPTERPPWCRLLLGDPTDFHSWPLLPWLSTVIFGWLIAHAYLWTRGDRRFCWGFGLAGAGIVATAALFGKLVPVFDTSNLIGPAVMAPAALSTLGLIGVAALLTAILTAVFADHRFRRYGLVRCYSHGILWIYIVHMIVGVRASRYLFSHGLDQEALLHDPGLATNLVFILSFPAFLLLLSWLVGALAIRWLHGKGIHLRLRRVRPARA